METPVDIFIAYSHHDKRFKDELKKMLRPLLNTGAATLWDDHDIEAGQDWHAEISKRLLDAGIIVLLVSPDSLASDYFYGREVAVSLERHTRGEAVVVPVILRPCLWDHTPLHDLEVLPEKGQAVTSSFWSSHDEAFSNVAQQLGKLIRRLRASGAHAPAAHRQQAVTTTGPTAVAPPPPTRAPAPIPAHLALVRGGTFDMGNVLNDNVYPNEKPVHAVRLGDFLLGKYTVTFEEYDVFCTATGREKPGDNGWGRGRRPVINVDWYDAVEYCNWLSGREGLEAAYRIDEGAKDPNNQNGDDPKKWTVIRVAGANGYRLPTEAEWEYAAREGGKTVRFGDGRDVLDPAHVNFNATASYKQPYSVVGEYRQKTVPVDELAANSLGLKHMSGNVWEWCWDWFDAGYYARSPAANPEGAISGEGRVCRGGSWYLDPEDCRAGVRSLWRPYVRSDFLGFRLARDYSPVAL